MAKEADAHSAEDKTRREEIDAKNQLDSMVYNIEKMLKRAATRSRARSARRGECAGGREEGHRRRREGADGFGAGEADGGIAQAGGAMYKATQATPGAAPGGAAPGDGHAAGVMARARRRTKA